MVVGDTIYFDAIGSSQTMRGIFAYDTSNHSWWRATSFSVGSLQGNMATLIGDTIYFDAYNATNKHEVMAFNTVNETMWQVSSFNYGATSIVAIPGSAMEIAVDDTLYFNANDGIHGDELWAYTTTNRTVWLVDDINHDFLGTNPVSSTPGQFMSVFVGDVLYFDAYGPDGDDPSNILMEGNCGHTTPPTIQLGRFSTSIQARIPAVMVIPESTWHTLSVTPFISAPIYTPTPNTV